ncbi:MAG TPA: amidohydrolase family protein [Streptosporangiaceae bacterium]
MRIDSHHHVWDLRVRPQPWTNDLPALQRSFGIEELRPSLKRHDIGATVVVQTVAVAEETAELLVLAASDPDIAGVVGWTDLTAPDVADRLAELIAPGLAGIRHLVQDEPDPRWLMRREVQAGIAAVGAAGLTYDLLVTPAQLPAAVETVRNHPDARFVLDHGAKPLIRDAILEPWNQLITDLAASPNVAVKLSGLVTEASPNPTIDDLRPYCDRLLSAFGPERMMFGSDWPVCLLRCDYDRVIAHAESMCVGLSKSEKADVFGETAARWYALNVTSAPTG